MADAIVVERLTHRYGDVTAVNEISFRVAPGEVLSLLGPNGAGKSTTIQVLTGQLRLQGGKVEILGHDRRRDRRAIQQRIGVSFEEKNLYEDMTAGENLALFAKLFGIPRFSPGALLERVGLHDKRDVQVRAFSKGMRQRLMIARSLINRPEVLFLDEPTDGLDPVSAQAVRRIIREQAAQGAAVMLTTHDMFEADALSCRVGFLNHGSIITLDTPQNLKERYGRRSLRVVTRAASGGDDEEHHLSLDDEKLAQTERALSAALHSGRLRSIHTEEATLEDIFIQLAGRALT